MAQKKETVTMVDVDTSNVAEKIETDYSTQNSQRTIWESIVDYLKNPYANTSWQFVLILTLSIIFVGSVVGSLADYLGGLFFSSTDLSFETEPVSIVSLFFMIPLSILLSAVSIVIYASITHLVCYLMKGSAEYVDTFKAICLYFSFNGIFSILLTIIFGVIHWYLFSQSIDWFETFVNNPLSFLTVIPTDILISFASFFILSAIYSIYSIVLVIKYIKQLHNLGGWAASFAILWPFVFFFVIGLLILFGVLLIGLIFGAF